MCECVWRRLFGLLFCFSVCECERAPQMSSTAEVCKFVCELICMHLFDSVVAHCLMCLYCILSSFLLMCMHVCGWLVHFKTVGLWVSEAALLVLFPLCHAQTAQSLHGLRGHHQNVHDRLHQDVMHSLCLEWISTDALILHKKACKVNKRIMQNAAWAYVFLFPNSSLIICFAHKEFPYDG